MTRDEKQTHESVAARIAALQKASLADLRAEWFTLFGAAAPVNSRDYLRDRLAYRIQELAFGGLKPATVKRLEAMGERLDGGNITTRRIRADLIRSGLTPVPRTMFPARGKPSSASGLSPADIGFRSYSGIDFALDVAHKTLAGRIYRLIGVVDGANLGSKKPMRIPRQYFGSRDWMTEEYFSALCGVTTVWSILTAITHTTGGDLESTATSATQHLPLFPDEMTTMRGERQLPLVENGYPIKAQGRPGFNDDDLKRLRQEKRCKENH